MQSHELNYRHAAVSLVSAMALAAGLLPACSQREVQADQIEADEQSAMQNVADAALTARIKTTFLFNRHLNSFRINVDTHDGHVTLQGVVPSDIQRDLAGAIAKNASGVKGVHNKLQVSKEGVKDPEDVDRTFGQAAMDATTTASVKMTLAFAKDVKASDIDVDTRWGTVTLTGTVGSGAERRLAEQLARETDGVKDVVNRLDVRG